jgi:UDP-N-acetylmuramate--alanine ligase
LDLGLPLATHRNSTFPIKRVADLNPDQVNGILDTKGPGATLYLVGAGGCGMSGLGHLFLDLGYRVAGSDLVSNPEVLQLLARGALIHTGHLAEQVKTARPFLVVYSSAIRPDNPELLAAQQLQIPVIRRGVALAALLRRQRGIGVAGMHGKTTTTALLAFALRQLEIKSSYAVGAPVPQLSPHARLEPGPAAETFFAAELDESDGTLREFQLEHAIVLNVDEEHLDYFSSLEAISQEFEVFASQSRGKIIYCADDPQLVKLFGGHSRAISYGFTAAADYRIEQKSATPLPPSESQGLSYFDIWHAGGRLGEFAIGLIGSKNISNAAAVIALLHQLDLKPLDIGRAICSFRGAARRQQQLFKDDRYRVIDDYGHHPNEISATLQAFKASTPNRILAVFQPHRFTRTRLLMNEFAACFKGADRLWLTEIYPASEAPIAGVNGAALASAVRQHGQTVEYVSSLDELPSRIREAMQPGDLVLFLGAGDITNAAHKLAADLQREVDQRKESLCASLAGRLSPKTVVRRDEMLAKRTTLRVGGRADLYVEPASEAELAEVLKFAAEHGLPFMVLGRGSNLLIQDGGIRGIVICLAHPSFGTIEVHDRKLRCGAGARLKAVASEAKRQGLTGLEFLEGIPGNIGGALRMNAGAMGGWMFNVVKSIRFMDVTGTIYEREAGEVKAEYRSCPLLKKNIALGAVLQGEPASREAIAEKMNACSQKRWKSQPAAPSAGCIFKNTLTVPAGKLIDELGLKGTRVGGAVISDVHGNFIVNDGNATAQDVLNLIELVKKQAKAARGIELETEVEIVGENASGGSNG